MKRKERPNTEIEEGLLIQSLVNLTLKISPGHREAEILKSLTKTLSRDKIEFLSSRILNEFTDILEYFHNNKLLNFMEYMTKKEGGTND